MYEKLSKSLAKFISTVWFSQSPVTKLLFDEAVEHGAEHWGRSRERRDAERFFEQCSDDVLSTSFDFLESEFKKLDNERVEVLVAEISNAFSLIRIDSSFSENRYSDKYLTEKIIGELKLVDKKSDVEVSFCRNVVGRISFYVCQYIHQAPDFVPVSIKQILDNQHEIAVLLKQVLKHAEPLEIEQSKLDVVGSSYLRDIKNSLKFIQVFGLSTYSIKKKYLLEASYISLSVSDEESEELESGRKADEFISSGKRLMIVGGAGSGKTTLLQWAALQCCEAEEKCAISDFSGLIPIFIRLRSVEKFCAGMSVLEAAKSTYSNLFINFDEADLLEKVEAGRVVFLIDGLDEVPSEERLSAMTWIDELSDWATNCRIVVTTRPLSDLSQHLWGFREAHLENMTHEDILKFVTYWHRAVASGLVGDEMIQSIDASRERLLVAISSIGSIRALATNPLMCAILCTLNLDRNCNIPREKSEIYRAAIELLLERRDKERNIGADTVAAIDPSTKRQILQETARWLTLNERPEISKVKFRSILSSEMPRLDEGQLDSVQSYFVERTGLLRDVSTNNIDFIHKQFQEYLAAESFVQEDDIGVLEKNIGSDAWGEIFPLACGLMYKNQISSFLREVLSRSKMHAGKRKRALQFQAILCAQFSRRVDEKLEEEIEALERDIFPPKSIEEVYQLLPLGDKLVPLVQNVQGKENSDNTIALCVKTIIETGGLGELPLISSFAEGAGEITVEQLISGWSFFDSDEYGRQVVSKIKSPYKVSWQGKNHIKGLVFAFNATSIILDECFGGTDLYYLPDSETCRELIISSDNYLSDLAGIEKLRNLEKLAIIACDEIRSIEVLSNCKGLKKLDFLHCRGIENISAVAELKELKHLSFKGCFNIEDISGLRTLKKLEELDLYGCYAVSDWRVLEGLPKLRELVCAEEGALDGLSSDFFGRVEVNGDWRID
ncbi:NACHT N-terminal Helical domain 1-containing protein [Aliiroseovarius crassostreae]|uniref:NACHT N-terminal Helical domain 1-containing protein n=1 Tax=Aliiroseovarius crassostreae TaxID=154981 RepID=UPI00220CEB12|nr:NACHT domain-containing protein [Aliiroseovarius crassostreae]UWP99462.1 NACHT domain-containing protein [Aliiroseovarius crassostreae]